MPDELAPGTVVQRYRIERVVGRGGMGSVYRAVHVGSGQVVAVKVMHPEVAERPALRKRFLREARAAMAVGHPSIVRILEVFEHAGTPMLAMELLDGESLESMLEREGRIPLQRLALILVHVTSAVGTAHALGIIHRDIKPENIFLTRGAGAPVRVLDFGIAKFTATEGAHAETAALTRTGAMMGTPFYMSPEQAFGEKRIDQRTDIWALGILVYRCLSGSLPTAGDSFGEVFKKVTAESFAPIRALVPDLPGDVCALVDRMLQKRAEDRPWDLREVHAVLERHASSSAPAFGAAVAPAWNEDGGPGSSDAAASAAQRVVPPAQPSKPIALTPASLPRRSTPPQTPGRTPPDTITSDTIAMDPPAMDAGATLVDAPPKSRTWIFVLVAIAALLFLGLAIAIKS